MFCLSTILLAVAASSIFLARPDSGGAATDVVTLCLSPCHSAPGLIGPDVSTAYLSEGENPGHRMGWGSSVVADASGATLPQGARMPCNECHVAHGRPTTSIYMFSETRVGSPITTARQLCEGCHRPCDSAEATPVVCGLKLMRLSLDVPDHSEASDRPCSDCHGPTGHSPESHASGVSCGDAACHGSSGSHGVHLDVSDPRGPGQLDCSDDCHQTGDFPYFKAGTDDDESGHIELDETTVCDECHSPSGDYDGVDDPVVGAKPNWASKVYQTLNSLQLGKEKWCASCHDGDESETGEEPSLIDGVYAPPVIGDEDGGYIYGTGWGFYKTGHGVPATQTIPSNGYDAGPGLDCDDCHDFMQTHIDGERRTFTSAGDSGDYRAGYRLDLVGGANPMDIPWANSAANDATRARLCYSCHDSGPFLNQGDRSTNFWNDVGTGDPVKYNMHEYHLSFSYNLRWSPDWGTTANSRISCPSCHNVHGSTRLGMVHDGELISDTVERRPGLQIWYWDDVLSSWTPHLPGPPSPDDITLAMSDGWAWRGATSSNLCTHCHGYNSTPPRALWQAYAIAPVLEWTGETGYESDGVQPNAGSAEETFAFRVSYSDANNDAPTWVRLLLDRNDDGDFGDAGEIVAMSAESPGDNTYYNGNIYCADVQAAKAGDNVLDYRFEALANGDTTSTPTRVLTVTNAPPRLPWTGEAGYTTDGVKPNSGTTDLTNFEFRIKYKDADGEAPAGGVKLYVDKNDDGDFGDAGEVVTMNDMGDPGFVTGKRYNHTTTLTRNIDGLVPYYFEATDGFDSVQSITSTVTVLENINQTPTLAWTGETSYVTDGVDPDNQAGGKPFFFRITYADANNDAPGVRQVWVDLDDDAVYEAGEKFAMNDSVTSSDPAMTDGDYTNGEIFGKKVYVPYAGDGTIKYCFYFEDTNAAEATGVHLTDKNLSVFLAHYVDGTGITGYATIQEGVNAASTGQTVLVADGTWAGWAFNNKDIYVESVNGPESTIVEQPGGRGVDFNYWSGNPSNSTVTGFTFRNSSYGVYANMSVAQIYDCIIEDNSVGLYNGSSGSWPVTIGDCAFRNNTTVAIQTNNNSCIVDIDDTEFSGNTGTNGSCLTGNGGNFTFDNCVFDGNSASGAGGAIYMNGVSQSYFRDCVFTDNVASGNGGAIYYVGSAATDTWVERCVFAGNEASSGGALYTRVGDYDIVNCTISGNYATTNGGGIRTEPGATVIRNCTIAGNSGGVGGGIYAQNNTTSQPDIYNCILWGNDSRTTPNDEIESNNLSRVEVQYTDINQAFDGFWNETGNMTANPLFVDPRASSLAATRTGDYHLQEGSPCEGQASDTYAPDDDIDNGSRPQGTADDMGSDEINESAMSMSSPPVPLGDEPRLSDASAPPVAMNGAGNAGSSKGGNPAPVPPAVPIAAGAVALGALGFRFLKF